LFREPDRPDWDDAILCMYYGGEFLYTQRMLITRRYKYVFNGFDVDEVYDLALDPHELCNVVDDPAYTGVVVELRDQLYALMERYGDPYAANAYGAPRYLSRSLKR
jgi:arylsulfatase A-like enzyme